MGRTLDKPDPHILGDALSIGRMCSSPLSSPRGLGDSLARKNQGPKECPGRKAQGAPLWRDIGTCFPRDTALGQGLTLAGQDLKPPQACWAGLTLRWERVADLYHRFLPEARCFWCEKGVRTCLRLWPLAEPPTAPGLAQQLSGSVPGCPGQLAFQVGQICAHGQQAYTELRDGWNEARRGLAVSGLKARLGDSAPLYREPSVV